MKLTISFTMDQATHEEAFGLATRVGNVLGKNVEFFKMEHRGRYPGRTGVEASFDVSEETTLSTHFRKLYDALAESFDDAGVQYLRGSLSDRFTFDL